MPVVCVSGRKTRARGVRRMGNRVVVRAWMRTEDLPSTKQEYRRHEGGSDAMESGSSHGAIRALI
jgi:hypothetical protein